MYQENFILGSVTSEDIACASIQDNRSYQSFFYGKPRIHIRRIYTEFDVHTFMKTQQAVIRRGRPGPVALSDVYLSCSQVVGLILQSDTNILL